VKGRRLKAQGLRQKKEDERMRSWEGEKERRRAKLENSEVRSQRSVAEETECEAIRR
jgi:hypothetical protein